MKKLLVCDLDGTLLDKNNNIDDYSLKMLKKFIDAGNDFSVCTGRLDADIKYIEKLLGVNGAYRISQNGAVIYDRTDEIVSALTIPDRLLPTINDVVFNRGLRVEVSTSTNRYFPSPRDANQVAEFVDTSIVEPRLAANVLHPSFHAVNYLIFGDNQSFQPIITELHEKLDNLVNVQQTSPSSLEIFSPEASKGIAVKKLITQQGYSKSQVYVAGDAENDITMFPLTVHNFAVGNLASTATIAAANKHAANIGDLINSMGAEL
ncbi:Cof-type HAD-IIB family hydrolase [Lactiplantibacillus pentosus]|uniref:Cof-type HAD-IIB family hydrolase n=1 Tax=Lactiplantibacillus pentosus TaxID=1589 RepID=UPI0034D769DE